MGKYKDAINAFSAGELSQKLRSRFDSDQYKYGLEKMENFLPLSSGGAVRRPGTRLVAEVSNVIGSYNNPRILIPFVVSKTEAYVVSIEVGGVITEAIKVFNREGTVIQATYSSGTYFPIDNFPADLDPAGFQYSQSADVMYITHSSGTIPAILLRRTGVNAFYFHQYANPNVSGSSIEFSRGVLKRTPFGKANIDITFQVRVVTGAAGTPYVVQAPVLVTLRWNTAPYNIQPGDVIRLTDNALQKEAVFLATTTIYAGTDFDALCLVNYGANLNANTDNFNISRFTKATGYPKSVSLYEQRLIFGGTPTEPDTMFCSAVGDFDRLITDRLDQDISTNQSLFGIFGDLTADDAFTPTISSNEVNEIKWMSPDDVLVVGTSGAEFVVSPIDGVFSRTNINVRAKTAYGSRDVQALKCGKGIIHVSRDGQRLRLFTYLISNGQTENTELTAMSSEIVHYNPGLANSTVKTKGITIRQMAWQQSRETMWLNTSRNALIGLTITDDRSVMAMHKHKLGGMLDSLGAAQILGICSIPNIENTFDELYILVKRTVNTVGEVVTLEKLGDDFEHDILVNTSDYEYDHPVCVDGALRFTAADASVAKTFRATSTYIDLVNDTADFLKRHNYHLGQEVVLTSSGAFPGGLPAGTYYLIPVSLTKVRFATSLPNALAGVYVDIVLPLPATTITVTPTPVATLTRWSGLDVFAGNNVKVFVDGQLSDYSVPQNLSPSASELYYTSDPASEVVIGYNFEATLVSLVLEAGGQFGPSRGNISRIDTLTIPVFKSYSGKFGPSESNLLPMPLDGSVPETTDLTVKFPQSPTRLPQVVVKSDEPYPLTVLSFISRGVSYDG